MKLAILHPLVAFRSCVDCKLWQYDENTGEVTIRRGEKLRRVGKPPCEFGPEKCPKGSPEAGRELSEKNSSALHHYMECRAVGMFPDDPIVRRNAMMIRAVLDVAERKENIELAAMGAGSLRKG